MILKIILKEWFKKHVEGYGNLAPVTEGGKIFCIIFVTIGIPYFGYMMSKLAENSNVIVLKIGKAAENKLKRGLPASLGTTLFSLMGFFFLIVGPVHLFYHMEGWDVLDSVYFIFISLSTTGFGDMVPRWFSQRLNEQKFNQGIYRQSTKLITWWTKTPVLTSWQTRCHRQKSRRKAEYPLFVTR